MLTGYSVLIAASVLATLFLAVRVLGLHGNAATTLSFLTLAFAQLWHVFNMRAPGEALLTSDVARNRWVWGALALCTALLLAAVYLPGFSGLLRLRAPSARGWALVLGMSLVPLLAGQVIFALRRRNRPVPTS
jgi:Ca2+-transporting ATPase